MIGVCQSCGLVRELKTCPVCGAQVCSDCLLEFGCKLCHGTKRI